MPEPNGNATTMISGHSNSITTKTGTTVTVSPAEILMHEFVSHTAARLGRPDSGDAIKDENKARSQIPGLQQRLETGDPEQ
ncbi:MAG TPA: hypothetical protein VIM02_12160 [Rhizomicrobium sp.]|jgi:hypothetical protein